MVVDLKIGVWPQKSGWPNKILWLFYDEFGYPAELITKKIQTYPIIIMPFNELTKSSLSLYRHVRSNGLLITCESDPTKEEVNKHEFPSKFLPVVFGETHHELGHCNVLKKETSPSFFFPKRKLGLAKRKDFNFVIPLKKIHVFPPAKTIVEFETIHGSRYPLLICGETKEGGRYAIIAASDEILECKDSNWGPLLYLAALEWCLRNKPFVRKWHWPNCKRVNVVLTFDFEGLPKYSSTKYCWWNRRFDWFLLSLGLTRILKFLSKNSIRSTWFVPGSQAINTPNLVKKLASNDLIELAGHGDVHIGIDKSARKFNEEDLSDQKNRLVVMSKIFRSIISISIKGFRAPGLYANHDTLLALNESGFTWDCSASPQTNYLTRWFFLPYSPVIDWENKHEPNIVEIPAIGPWDRWCPIHGSFHSPQEYRQEILEDFNFLHFIGGLQILVIHPYQIAVRRVLWKVLRSFITKIFQFSDVALSTCGEVCYNWMRRKKMSMTATYHHDTSSIYIQVRNAQPNLSILVRIPEKQYVDTVLLDGITQIPFKRWDDIHSIVFAAGIRGDGKYIIPLHGTAAKNTRSKT